MIIKNDLNVKGRRWAIILDHFFGYVTNTTFPCRISRLPKILDEYNDDQCQDDDDDDIVVRWEITCKPTWLRT